MTIEKNTVDVRQGSARPKLIYVLGAGLALVIAAFLLAWFVGVPR